MRARFAPVLFGLSIAPLVYAQSKVDQVPHRGEPQSVPLSPAAPDEVTTAPGRNLTPPELIGGESESEPRLINAAPDVDTLGHHILPYAALAYTWGFGSLDSQMGAEHSLASGPALQLGLDYGLTRSIELGADVLLALPEGGCTECSSRLFDANLHISYHLVQGVRFDPWVRLGLGLSSLRLSSPNDTHSYFGPNWITAAVGGDWYATRNVGIGPLLAFGLTSYTKRPEGTDMALVERLTLGLQVVFDVNGK